MCNLAGSLAQAGEVERSAIILGYAKAIIETLETEPQRAPALTHLVGALIKSGQAEDAKTTLKAVLESVDAIPGIEQKITVLAGISSALKDIGDDAQAREVLAKTLALARQIHDQSRAVLKQSLQLAGQIADSGEKASALKTIALAMSQPGDPKAAEETFVQALTIATQIPDPAKKTAALEDIASAFTATQPGNAFAQLQFSIGWMYYEGKNLPRNIAQAAQWYRQAADHGHPQAQVNLGVMYNEGQGVPANNAEAMKLFSQAAEQGHTEGQVALGMMLALGQVGPPDYIQATKWLTLAANAGDPSAQQAQAELAKKMTPTQVAQAQKLAKAWTDSRQPKKN